MYHGVINIYKEKGYTSHDVVAKLRKILHMKKIGHTGTLDPNAQGVLPVCLGAATRLCEMLTEKEKVYETVLLLGKETDTQDIDGAILSEHEVTVSEKQAEEAVLSFAGEYWQIPPMYSALKVNGKKLYELAREGKEVERKARLVKIYEITILEMQLPRIRMRVRCSKGTYIRTLCYDIGEKLGCKGCMEELIRTQVSGFSINTALTLQRVEEEVAAGKIEEFILPIDQILGIYPALTVQKPYSKLLYNGNPLMPEYLESFEQEAEKMENPIIQGKKDKTVVRVYDDKKRFIALYTYRNDRFYLVKMFFGSGEILASDGKI